MLFKRLNRDQPEQVFVVAENNEGATIDIDATVQVDTTTDVDGVKVRDMDTGDLYAFMGVADAAIADNNFGLIQVYGYRSTSQILTTDTSIAAGLPLIPVAGQEYFNSFETAITQASSTDQQATTITLQPTFGCLLESITTSTGTASLKIFIRAM